jgi:hypothetical protein
MNHRATPASSWLRTSAKLRQSYPSLHELEPGGALTLPLDDGDWLLEITPDGRLICQTGIDMDDLKSLLSDGTPEELGTDELAKQAKYYLQPAVSKFRRPLLEAGFEEATEMNAEFVAVTFHRSVDLGNADDVSKAVEWCLARFRA